MTIIDELEGISDGLELPCAVCDKWPVRIDYLVDDIFWEEIVPDEIQRDVICLSCLDQMAEERGLDISKHLRSIQFIGIEKTIIMDIDRIILWSELEQ